MSRVTLSVVVPPFFFLWASGFAWSLAAAGGRSFLAPFVGSGEEPEGGWDVGLARWGCAAWRMRMMASNLRFTDSSSADTCSSVRSCAPDKTPLRQRPGLSSVSSSSSCTASHRCRRPCRRHHHHHHHHLSIITSPRAQQRVCSSQPTHICSSPRAHTPPLASRNPHTQESHATDLEHAKPVHVGVALVRWDRRQRVHAAVGLDHLDRRLARDSEHEQLDPAAVSARTPRLQQLPEPGFVMRGLR
eukprot:1846884-Rhodomonas_salina.1